MDYTLLEETSFEDLKKMAKDMGLSSHRSKSGYIKDIKRGFEEYEKYKHNKIDKYTRIRQLGNKGKEGVTYLVLDKKNREFAMKTFRNTKSSNTLKNEYILQKNAASVGIAPRVVEYDSISKYIVMEKMEFHLMEILSKNNARLSRNYQYQILDIFEKLDKVKVFHGDSNILNYMIKNSKVYIIDFGFSREITDRLVKKLGTSTPNTDIMTLGLILKLKELNCDPFSWKYLIKKLSKKEVEKFQLHSN